MDQTFMKEKPIFPLLLSLAIPTIISMLVNSLYNIVDSMFIAKISEDALTSLSLVFPIQNLVSSTGVGFGVGINAVIAMNLGAQEGEKASAAATLGLFLNIVHGACFTLFGILAMPAFLGLFTDSDEIIHMGVDYATIVLAFSMVITAEITVEKIFQAVGRMVLVMVSMLCGFATNIILDPLLIFGIGPFPEMGIKGAALATAIGQMTILVIYLAACIIKPLNIKLSLRYLKPNRSLIGQLYFIGIPATLNMALPSVLVSALNSILAGFSQSYVLVLGIYYKLQTFLYMPANGVIQGMRPLLSYNYGAQEKKRVKEIYRISLTCVLLIMGIGMILSLTIPSWLMGLFTENLSTIQIGVPALRTICFGFIVSAFSVTSAGALEALGKGPQSLTISCLRYVILLIPAAFLLSRILGADGIWHAFWMAETAAALIAFRIYKKYSR